MDTQSAISFAASAPFIATIIGFLAASVPTKFGHGYYPFAALILASVWGIVLKQGGYWEGSAATFIVTDLTVAYAVAGIMSQARNTGISVSVGRAATDATGSTSAGAGVSADQVIAIVEQAIDKLFPQPVPAPAPAATSVEAPIVPLPLVVPAVLTGGAPVDPPATTTVGGITIP